MRKKEVRKEERKLENELENQKKKIRKDGELINPTTHVQNVIGEWPFILEKLNKVLMVIILDIKVKVIHFLKNFRQQIILLKLDNIL